MPNDLLSVHAHRRMSQRGIRMEAIRAALEVGRPVHTRGAEILVIGRREVRAAGARGVDLGRFEGIQVVCVEGVVVTVYRNRDFRGLRPRWRARTKRPTSR